MRYASGDSASNNKEISMRKILMTTAAGVAFAVFQSAAWAVDAKMAQDEMKEHGCLACHDMDKKKVGPAYKEVSAKYKGKAVEDVMAGMKSKPVHKGALAKTTDSSLKVMLEYVQTQ
jgi:cytochrome c